MRCQGWGSWETAIAYRRSGTPDTSWSRPRLRDTRKATNLSNHPQGAHPGQRTAPARTVFHPYRRPFVAEAHAARAVEGEGRRYRHRSPRTFTQKLTPPRRVRIASDPGSKSPAARAAGEAGCLRPHTRSASPRLRRHEPAKRFPGTRRSQGPLGHRIDASRSPTPKWSPIRRTNAHTIIPRSGMSCFKRSTPEEPRAFGRTHRNDAFTRQPA
jgi:hypothetical protein